MLVCPLLVFYYLVLNSTIDTGSPDDVTEVSFRKGEILDVMTKSDLWWEVRKSNGTKGSE